MSVELVHVQPTPNPNAFKFHAEEPIVPAGSSLAFPTEESAEALPIARALFEQGDVTAVLVAEDFVSVSGTPDANWMEIRDIVERELPKIDLEGIALLADERRARLASERASRQPSELERRIEEAMDEYVRPALAGDGGGIELVGVDGKIVIVRYQGACGSCPTSRMQTLSAIEGLLRDQIDPELVVEPA